MAEKPGPPRDSALRELREWLPGNLSSLPALLALAGALAYGALNVASTVFYQGLGVTPSAVGLGYAELLARVAVIAAIVAATALVGVVVVAFAVRILVRWGGIPGSRPAARLKLAVVGLLAIAVYALLLSVPPPLALRWSWADAFALATFGALVAIGVLIALHFFDKELARSYDIELRYVLIAGAVWLLLAPLSFVAHAIEGANEVEDGRRQRESLFGSPFPWQVAVAEVIWVGAQDQPDETRGCLLYLGSSNSVAVFYDSADKRSLQVPAANVIVDVDPSAPSC